MNQMPDRLAPETRRALLQNQSLLMTSAAAIDGARTVVREFGGLVQPATVTELEQFHHVVTVTLGGQRAGTSNACCNWPWPRIAISRIAHSTSTEPTRNRRFRFGGSAVSVRAFIRAMMPPLSDEPREQSVRRRARGVLDGNPLSFENRTFAP
jgi:hypothetical protein